MKFSLALAIAAATGYVSAQDLSQIPSCALTCLVPAVQSVGCGPTDFKCSCAKASQLNSAAGPCIRSTCSDSDQSKANTGLQSICSQAGVPITIPGGGSTPASSAPAASSPAASSPAASSPAASSPAASSPAASSPAASSRASSTPAGYGATTTPAGTTPKPTTNATTSIVPYTGGAGKTGISFGAAIAVLAGAIYAL